MLLKQSLPKNDCKTMICIKLIIGVALAIKYKRFNVKLKLRFTSDSNSYEVCWMRNFIASHSPFSFTSWSIKTLLNWWNAWYFSHTMTSFQKFIHEENTDLHLRYHECSSRLPAIFKDQHPCLSLENNFTHKID